MDGDKPQMRSAVSEQRVGVAGRFEPFQETFHFLRDARGRRRFVVHLLPTDRPGDQLHRSAGIIPPVMVRDAPHGPGSEVSPGGTFRRNFNSVAKIAFYIQSVGIARGSLSPTTSAA